jgi:transposase InsO family protein
LELEEQASSLCIQKTIFCSYFSIPIRSLQRWKKKKNQNTLEKKRSRKPPANKLTEAEELKIMEVVNSKDFCDLTPDAIVAKLSDQGLYLASPRTIYRLLKKHKLCSKRRRGHNTNHSKPKELIATGPNQIYSWDITYIKVIGKKRFHYLYMMIDIYSRKIVMHRLHTEESGDNAAKFLEDCYHKNNITPGQIVLHSDNGAPMKCAAMTQKAIDLGVELSRSRPRVSDDNPYSEACFKTVKYNYTYPESGFSSIEEAAGWFDNFVNWYNNEHYHSELNWVTPESRHNLQDADILSKRTLVYEEARKAHPERWSKGIRDWSPVQEVSLNPNQKKKKIQRQEKITCFNKVSE